MVEPELLANKESSAGGRAADALFRRFVDLIESGELKEGEALPPEREIVEAYGVSRTVAREAVQALAARGLVEARPRYRPVVRKPSFETAVKTMNSVVTRLLQSSDGVRNLFDTRILVEAGLVREAAKSATAAQITRLEAALEANRIAIPDTRKFYESDLAFHILLYEMSGNPALVSVHKAFAEWLSPHWLKMGPDADRNARNNRAHAAILDGIRTGDPDRAEVALRAHLADAWQQVHETFG